MLIYCYLLCSLDPNDKPWVLCSGLRSGSKADWDLLIYCYLLCSLDPNDKPVGAVLWTDEW